MLSATLALTLLSTLAADPAREGADYGTFEVSRLRAVIGNNKALGDHRERYNGVFSLAAPDCAETPFVPLYAGLNLENFFDARPRHEDDRIFFEPRTSPMTFTRVNDTTAELYQPATPFYGIESWTRFELKEPYYIDFSFRCVAHKPDLAGGYFGVFWASYINAPDNKSYYFLEPKSTLDNPVWVQFLTQQHDRDSTVRSAAGGADVPLDTTKPCLWTQISPLRYGAPFFYGRFRDRVLIYIFEPNDNLRFAHSPSGGGRSADGHDSNPAWDFQLIVPDYKVGQEYSLRGRLVYKPWVGRDDVLNEVRRFR